MKRDTGVDMNRVNASNPIGASKAIRLVGTNSGFDLNDQGRVIDGQSIANVAANRMFIHQTLRFSGDKVEKMKLTR